MDPHPSGGLCPSREAGKRRAVLRDLCHASLIDTYFYVVMVDWIRAVCGYLEFSPGHQLLASQGPTSLPLASEARLQVFILAEWDGLGKEVENSLGLPVGPPQGAANTKVGNGGGPDSAKPHAALGEPAFWIQQYPEKSVAGTLVGWQAGWGTHHWETHRVSVSQGFPGRLWLVCASASIQSWILWEASLGQITVQSCRSGQRMNAETL